MHKDAQVRNNRQVLPAERRRAILDRLERQGRVVATELGAELGVSHDTVRRDLADLAAEGLAERVHGGALRPITTAKTYAERRAQAAAGKRRVAEAAAHLLGTGQVAVLSGGTTTVELAAALPTELAATVFTNSPPVALELAGRPAIEVQLLGGRIDPERLITYGADAIETIRDVSADVCFLSPHSLDAEGGLRVCALDEARLMRAMIASATDVVALVTEEKFATRAAYRVAPMSELTHLVTEGSVDDVILEPYRLQGIEVTRV
jgi:DeoR/GlpR family transcriptional regulator of sugar metabolism